MGAEWTTDNGEVRRFNNTLEYSPGLNKVVQINYRYVDDPSSYSSSFGTDSINQLGSKIAWPVNLNLNMVGSYYYDTILQRTIDAYAGMQYETCCWALRLGYQNKLKSTYDNGSVVETRYDEGVTLQFSLKGMGGQGVGNLSDGSMLDQGHFRYGRPFYLD